MHVYTIDLNEKTRSPLVTAFVIVEKSMAGPCELWLVGEIRQRYGRVGREEGSCVVSGWGMIAVHGSRDKG